MIPPRSPADLRRADAARRVVAEMRASTFDHEKAALAMFDEMAVLLRRADDRCMVTEGVVDTLKRIIFERDLYRTMALGQGDAVPTGDDR